MTQRRKILVGKILGAHGVKGDVRVRSFTEKPETLFAFKSLTDASGRAVVLKRKGAVKGDFFASVEVRENDPPSAKTKDLPKSKSKFSLLPPQGGKESSLVGSRVTDRDQAEELKGTELFIERSALPPVKKYQYYEADLVGLSAHGEGGKACGKVVAVHNYGAGTFLEIQPVKGRSFMLPFNDGFVPVVDVQGGCLTVVVPDGWVGEK
jgi:16S rRNA processing protein RimM